MYIANRSFKKKDTANLPCLKCSIQVTTMTPVFPCKASSNATERKARRILAPLFACWLLLLSLCVPVSVSDPLDQAENFSYANAYAAPCHHAPCKRPMERGRGHYLPVYHYSTRLTSFVDEQTPWPSSSCAFTRLLDLVLSKADWGPVNALF